MGNQRYLGKVATAMMEKRKAKLGNRISAWIDIFAPDRFDEIKEDVCDWIDSRYSDWDFWRRYYQIEESTIEYLEKRWTHP